ncbi:hypothetical protein QFZ75_007980 [Streptomyces sp. V3I8]|uniref:hypothetical protein n=1 Tax=Streptomyces sp. V3I8 TaxID=3042279 RepID=UPI002787C876|nr:hypothetical protein [Streptomyces sp. V3I8]MDQ1041478.1 hypothetical protein [Streptomyces sp. V3I8]
MSDSSLGELAIRFANQDQRHTYLALGRLLTRAARAQLPTLAWTVPVHSGTMLVGEVTGAWLTDAEKREIYDRWLAFFPDVKCNEEQTYGHSVVRSFVPQNVDWLRHPGEKAPSDAPDLAHRYRTDVLIRLTLD